MLSRTLDLDQRVSRLGCPRLLLVLLVLLLLLLLLDLLESAMLPRHD